MARAVHRSSWRSSCCRQRTRSCSWIKCKEHFGKGLLGFFPDFEISTCCIHRSLPLCWARHMRDKWQDLVARIGSQSPMKLVVGYSKDSITVPECSIIQLKLWGAPCTGVVLLESFPWWPWSRSHVQPVDRKDVNNIVDMLCEVEHLVPVVDVRHHHVARGDRHPLVGVSVHNVHLEITFHWTRWNVTEAWKPVCIR